MEPVPRETSAPWLSKRSDKWRVQHNWIVYVDGIAWTVPEGYVTDLSSIPRPVWWLFPRGYTPSRRASVLHDWFYSHGYKWVSREYADKVFKEMMLMDGSPKIVAEVFYRAVRVNFTGGGW